MGKFNSYNNSIDQASGKKKEKMHKKLKSLMKLLSVRILGVLTLYLSHLIP